MKLFLLLLIESLSKDIPLGTLHNFKDKPTDILFLFAFEKKSHVTITSRIRTEAEKSSPIPVSVRPGLVATC